RNHSPAATCPVGGVNRVVADVGADIDDRCAGLHDPVDQAVDAQVAAYDRETDFPGAGYAQRVPCHPNCFAAPGIGCRSQIVQRVRLSATSATAQQMRMTVASSERYTIAPSQSSKRALGSISSAPARGGSTDLSNADTPVKCGRTCR